MESCQYHVELPDVAEWVCGASLQWLPLGLLQQPPAPNQGGAFSLEWDSDSNLMPMKQWQ